MPKLVVRLAALTALPLLCFAVATKTWTTSSYADFEKCERKGVSLRSDGRITLAPVTEQLFDSGLAYLWALARSSDGTLYAGGGPGARVYRFQNGKCEKVAEFEAVEVHALAIDAQNRVYAATFPDGRIYRLVPGGKPEEFYNPKCKYIWSMLFDPQGNLYVATGDNGEIHRVSPDGKGRVFFHSDDTHVRSLAFNGRDLIAGTDPTGLVIRVNPEGQGFVLYQLPKREVTAVAIAPDGSIYASGAGTQPAAGGNSSPLAAVVSAPAPVVPPASPAGGGGTIVVTPERAPVDPSRALARATSPLTGGSDVYRIDRDGVPGKVWSHPQDVVYSIAFDREGRALLGAGNKGVLYRVDSPSLYTALTTLNVNQITALLTLPDGSIAAATANIGQVFRFGPNIAKQGVVVGDVFDSGAYSKWGRLASNGELAHGTIRLEAHSGNLDRPRNYWSAWAASAPPPARFVQWRATLASTDGRSPELDSVEQAYLPRNIAPRVDQIESTPPNYKFPDAVARVAPQRLPATLALPPLGRKPSTGPAPSPPDADASSLSFAKGWIGARWSAEDENGDPLTYTLQIRGISEQDWKPLKEKLTDRHFSFDSTAFPDGDYRIRVAASDQAGNAAGEALESQLDSAPFRIDNTPPVITALQATPSTGKLRVTWKAADALSVIKRAEYSLDGGDWQFIDPVTQLSDARELEYTLPLDHLSTGEHTVAARVTDDFDNTATGKIIFRK